MTMVPINRTHFVVVPSFLMGRTYFSNAIIISSAFFACRQEILLKICHSIRLGLIRLYPVLQSPESSAV